MKRASLHTLGCRLNQAETTILESRLRREGYEVVEFGQPTDLLVVNTCSVTDEAERTCRYVIRKTLKHSPDAFVAITGCYAQTGAQELRTIPGIDLIVGGHSHTLLGEGAQLAPLGLTPEGKYPTEVTTPDGGKTLVVQAWQWGHELGRLRVNFDWAGRVVDTSAAAIISMGPEFSRDGVVVPPDSPAYREILQAIDRSGVARIVAEEPGTAAALAPYTAQLEAFRSLGLGLPLLSGLDDCRIVSAGLAPLFGTTQQRTDEL